MDERMLRHALMEANLERFRDVLDAAEVNIYQNQH